MLAIAFLVLISVLTFAELVFKGFVPISTDIMVGSYFPWLDYKWGYAVGVPVKNALLSDPFSAFFIQKHLIIDLFSQGVLPLWNKYILSGTPLLATYHTSVFFPANLFLLLPKYSGWSLFVGGSTIASLLSMYLYLGGHVKSKFSRVIGSLVFAFSGLMTTWFELGTAVWSMSIIPLVLYSLDQIYVHKKHLFFPVLSFLTTFFILAGNVQLTTYAGFLFVTYSFFLHLQTNSHFSYSVKTFVFLSLGLGLSAIQLVPTFDLLQNSIRGTEKYATNFNYGLVEVPQLIRLWVADFFGNPSTHNHWGKYEYHEYSSFLGTLSLPLIFPLFFKRYRNPQITFYIRLFELSLFLVILHPISRLIFSLPLPLLTYSLASRLFFLVTLSSSVLVAHSVEQLDRKILLKSSFLALLLIAITAIAIVATPEGFRTVALRNSAIPLVLLSSLSIYFLFKIPIKVVVLLLLLTFSFDMTRYFRKYNPFVEPGLVFPETPAIEYVSSQPGTFRIAREKTNLLPPNTWSQYKLESVEGYEPLRPLNYSRFFHLLENGKYFNQSHRFSELEDVNPKFLDALNVKYFFIVNQEKPTLIQQKLLDHGYTAVFTDKSVTVLENPKVSPRAYFAEKLVQVPSEDDLAKTLESVEFQPTKTAILLEPLPGEISTTKDVPEIIKHDHNQIFISTSTTTPQFMILADNYDKGWKATTNGKPLKVYRVNGSLRGVYLPADNNQVIFKYQPDSLKIGALISAISLVLVSILAYTKRKS